MISNTNLGVLLGHVGPWWHLDETSINLVCMPLFHIGGSGWALVGMAQGAHSILFREFAPAEILASLEPRRGPERILDLMLRAGAWGDAFGESPDGLTLAQLEASPHGIDLGAHEPRLPDVLRTRSGRIELAPGPITADVPRLRERLEEGAWNGAGPGLVLIGRRQLRSNNSWMHNLNALVKGKERCTALVNPLDAERCGVSDGERAVLRSAAGRIEVPVEVSDEVMPGVVSVPHGWGHDRDGVGWSTAKAHAGVSANDVTDDQHVDRLSGTSALNGLPVEVRAAAPAEAQLAAAGAS
jgi:hypothetical protein